MPDLRCHPIFPDGSGRDLGVPAPPADPALPRGRGTGVVRPGPSSGPVDFSPGRAVSHGSPGDRANGAVGGTGRGRARRRFGGGGGTDARLPGGGLEIPVLLAGPGPDGPPAPVPRLGDRDRVVAADPAPDDRHSLYSIREPFQRPAP